MKLKSSIAAIVALSGMSFAGGMIMEPAYENEVVEVPVEPVVEEREIVTPPPAVTPPPKKEVKVVEVPKPKPVVVEKPTKPSGLYIAGGLTDVAVMPNGTLNLFTDKKGQDRQIGFTGRVGYDFMDYLGAELRGTYGIAKDKNNKFKQIGGYLKPHYNVTDEIDLYGLFGASKTNVGVGSQTGLSFGAGLDYAISDKVSVFTDVVDYLEKSHTAAQWGLTLGAGYKF
ncbi:hypothetical protein MNB_SV-14-168 [hydrothermal vent metagenome]|uniref:Outer membrane protein beta-barrel domain-containing protein n=1 Tax=hydrothermal vent metagenome TaxID=652676 RepID=A0A1W1CP86_9ZZZZ